MEIAHLALSAVRRRTACYRELVALTEATATYATSALAHHEGLPATPPRTRLRTHLVRFPPGSPR